MICIFRLNLSLSDLFVANSTYVYFHNKYIDQLIKSWYIYIYGIIYCRIEPNTAFIFQSELSN
jgi:hypothetical protein